MKRIVSRRPDPDFVTFISDLSGVDYFSQPLGDPNLWFVLSIKDAGGRVMAGFAVEYLHDFDALFSGFVADRRAFTRRILMVLFASLFSRVARLTAKIDPEHHASKDIVRRMGFVYEGFLRRGLDGDRDAELYGMLVEDCRYLPGFRARPTLTAPATATMH
jgi:RimJ/RimL family protein N-acetyltransferase